MKLWIKNINAEKSNSFNDILVAYVVDPKSLKLLYN